MAFDNLIEDKTELVNKIKKGIEILEKKYRIYWYKGQMNGIEMNRISGYKI